jgi:hypothetical protein
MPLRTAIKSPCAKSHSVTAISFARLLTLVERINIAPECGMGEKERMSTPTRHDQLETCFVPLLSPLSSGRISRLQWGPVPLFLVDYGILRTALRSWSSPAAFFTLGSGPRSLAPIEG